MKSLDSVQQALIEFFKKNTHEEWLTLREIATAIGVKHPQTTLNKLNQLVQLWYFSKDANGYKLIREEIIPNENDIFYLPIYWFAQCGNKWSAIVNEYSQEKMPVTMALVGTKNIGSCFFVRAKWNSMEPKIQDGDLILIKQQDHYDINDYIFVIHNELPKLKKIIKKDGQLMLESVNRFFDDITIEPYDQTKVIGSVKRVIKSL
jgi:phage repressor protein C with HTH and peptisase S24 domain